MKYFALDIETIGLKIYNGTIWMLAVNDGKKTKVEHDCFGKAAYFEKYRAILEDENICKVIHNAAFDGSYIGANTGIIIRNIWDTSLCETVLQGVQIPRGSRDEHLKAMHSSSLKYTLARYGLPVPNKDITKQFIDRPVGTKFTKEEIEYAGDDVKSLLELQRAQEYLLTRDGLLEVALLENKVVEKTIQMALHGVGFDSTRWMQIANETEAEYYLRKEKLPKSVSNWNSPKQVKDYFRSKGIEITSYSELEAVYKQTGNEVLGNFMAMQELTKTISSYGRNWFEEMFIDGDNRVRCFFQQIINTGRYSSSKPNMQNLPSTGQHRSAFVPKKGHVFVVGDFSGQEMAIIAAASGEDIWIDALLRGDDIHAITASLLFAGQWESVKQKGCTFPQKCDCKVHKILRGQTKTLNFMLAYGGGPQKFAESTGLSLSDAKVIVARYKRVARKANAYLERNGKEALNTGVSFSADPYRRRRVLRGEEDWQVVNQGKNTPIQSAGANMLKLSMVSIPYHYPIVLTVHDEIVLEVPKAQGKEALKMLQSVMEKSADYITGIAGLVKATPYIDTNLLKH